MAGTRRPGAVVIAFPRQILGKIVTVNIEDTHFRVTCDGAECRTALPCGLGRPHHGPHRRSAVGQVERGAGAEGVAVP